MTASNEFNMKTDFWRLEIENASTDEVKIKIIIYKDNVPEAEYRTLENHIRMILQGCGRLEPNPSKR
jgi:hypothetical protein